VHQLVGILYKQNRPSRRCERACQGKEANLRAEIYGRKPKSGTAASRKPGAQSPEHNAQSRNLRPCGGRDWLSRTGAALHILSAIRFLATLTDINAALEERAVFDTDARCDNIAGQ
jgi:hypothetical protein